MYEYNKININVAEQPTLSPESLLEKLYDLLEEANDEGIDNANEIKFALQCAEFESRLNKFIVDSKISQRILIAVFSSTLADQIRKTPHPHSAQKQVYDMMSKIINNKV